MLRWRWNGSGGNILSLCLLHCCSLWPPVPPATGGPQVSIRIFNMLCVKDQIHPYTTNTKERTAKIGKDIIWKHQPKKFKSKFQPTQTSLQRQHHLSSNSRHELCCWRTLCQPHTRSPQLLLNCWRYKHFLPRCVHSHLHHRRVCQLSGLDQGDFLLLF